MSQEIFDSRWTKGVAHMFTNWWFGLVMEEYAHIHGQDETARRFAEFTAHTAVNYKLALENDIRKQFDEDEIAIYKKILETVGTRSQELNQELLGDREIVLSMVEPFME